MLNAAAQFPTILSPAELCGWTGKRFLEMTRPQSLSGAGGATEELLLLWRTSVWTEAALTQGLWIQEQNGGLPDYSHPERRSAGW